MELIVIGVLAGILGTLVMDVLNGLAARTGAFAKIDVVAIGRMAVGWTRGRFVYGHPDDMQQVPDEGVYGYVAHYAIGVALSVPFLLAWSAVAGELPSPTAALLYGVATTAASFFFVYPSMGLGVCGQRSPDKTKAFISPIANHFFYGLGLAIGVWLAGRAVGGAQ